MILSKDYNKNIRERFKESYRYEDKIYSISSNSLKNSR